MPTPRAGNAASLFDDKIVIAGGESFFQAFAHNELELLDTKDLQWSNLPSMPIGRHGTGLIVKNGSLYTCSGSAHQGGGPELDDLIRLHF